MVFPAIGMLNVWVGKIAIDFVFTVLLVKVLGNPKLLTAWLPVSLTQPLMVVVAAVKGFLGKYQWK